MSRDELLKVPSEKYTRGWEKLPDDYQIHYGYYYFADDTFFISRDSGTVADIKPILEACGFGVCDIYKAELN